MFTQTSLPVRGGEDNRRCPERVPARSLAPAAAIRTSGHGGGRALRHARHEDTE